MLNTEIIDSDSLSAGKLASSITFTIFTSIYAKEQ